MNMKKGFYPAKESSSKKTMSSIFKKAPPNPENMAKKLGPMPKPVKK